MSERKQRERRQWLRTLALIPTPADGASAKVQLALRLRNEATLTGRCACGAVQELFEVEADGSLRPASAVTAGHAYYAQFQHADDCPAISPEVERAVARGEVSDPGGDLVRALLNGDDGK